MRAAQPGLSTLGTPFPCRGKKREKAFVLLSENYGIGREKWLGLALLPRFSVPRFASLKRPKRTPCLASPAAWPLIIGKRISTDTTSDRYRPSMRAEVPRPCEFGIVDALAPSSKNLNSPRSSPYCSLKIYVLPLFGRLAAFRPTNRANRIRRASVQAPVDVRLRGSVPSIRGLCQPTMGINLQENGTRKRLRLPWQRSYTGCRF